MIIITLEAVNYNSCTDLYTTPMSKLWCQEDMLCCPMMGMTGKGDDQSFQSAFRSIGSRHSLQTMKNWVLLFMAQMSNYSLTHCLLTLVKLRPLLPSFSSTYVKLLSVSFDLPVPTRVPCSQRVAQ